MGENHYCFPINTSWNPCSCAGITTVANWRPMFESRKHFWGLVIQIVKTARGSRSVIGNTCRWGREELFDPERHREPVPGWQCRVLACVELREGS